MKSKFSKLIAAITLASSAMSSFNGCVSGMEVGNQSEQNEVDNLTKEFLKYVKNEKEYKLFAYVLTFASEIAANPSLDCYVFYKKGITVGNILDNVHKWMRNPDTNIRLFTNDHENYTFDRFDFSDSRNWKNVLIARSEKYHAKPKTERYIDLIFEQISKSLKKTKKYNEEATESSMKELDNFFDKVYELYDKKLKAIAAGKINLKKRVLNAERFEKNVGENCEICLKETSRKDVQVPCCGKIFHKGCLQGWVQQKEICPNCRSKLSEEFIEDNLNN